MQEVVSLIAGNYYHIFSRGIFQFFRFLNIRYSSINNLNQCIMKNYIIQLIDDIHEAKNHPSHPKLALSSFSEYDEDPDIVDFSYVEEYLYGKEEKISDIVGIDILLLPEPELLDADDAATLAREMTMLLNRFNFYPDFPENYPLELQYRFLRNLWNDEHVFMTVGETHIDFCEYELESCPFPGYCKSCEEFDIRNPSASSTSYLGTLNT
jgi:hypothetical protein